MTEKPVETRIAEARAELEHTLDAIEDKLNVPKRVNEIAGQVRSSYASNPIPWLIGATLAAIAVAGVIAWAILSDDDD
jgi:hypothetical protein